MTTVTPSGVAATGIASIGSAFVASLLSGVSAIGAAGASSASVASLLSGVSAIGAAGVITGLFTLPVVSSFPIFSEWLSASVSSNQTYAERLQRVSIIISTAFGEVIREHSGFINGVKPMYGESSFF
jgi:hypothetical protein